ncbi:potassium channel protein [Marinihelvus fidelis]|uniref:Potassium channel protein n=1 Tax=Marinihelvus fidelis TaxID=2613842 RepID=A0A5N0TDM3_9GAMM|nr:potassium channel protein [Marinihelvus fidelis]KAA9133193.1 potassium channel protein [Marinihelvus fidelis]
MYGMNDIVWLTMRRMRLPLIVLLLVFFASVLVMVTLPGVNAEGEPVHLSYLDAAYFVAIMSTTIGFGEIPYPFTDTQRMVVLALVFPNVIAWLYSFGVILQLLLDRQFQQVMARSRFGRKVRGMGSDSFYLVCGFGSTGYVVVQGLLARGKRAVVMDADEDLVHARALDPRFTFTPIFGGDPTIPANLERAGLERDNCRGVIITTDDDHANLTMAITSKLLRPSLPVFARSEDDRVSDNMRSFGTDHVINPYEIFAERLYLALTSPIKYLVQDWLITVPGKPMRHRKLEPRTGRWIVCGAGRFGSQVIERLARDGTPYTVVDVHPERSGDYEGAILGRGTEAHTLKQAGIEDAVGIIACTGDDIDNLSIIMTARELNDKLFQIVRQEDQRNTPLFDKLGADLVAQRSLIVARRILAVATNPMLATFLDHLVHENDEFAEKVFARLKACVETYCGQGVEDWPSPQQWTVELDASHAPGAAALFEADMELTLSYLLHNTRSERDEDLHCVCLEIERGAQRLFLPANSTRLQPGDRLLFAGWGRARHEMMWSLEDPVLLLNYATPGPAPRTSIGRWLWRRRQADSGRI